MYAALFQWRERVEKGMRFHSLIIACQTMMYSLRSHPFPDENGRASRMMVHDYWYDMDMYSVFNR